MGTCNALANNITRHCSFYDVPVFPFQVGKTNNGITNTKYLIWIFRILHTFQPYPSWIWKLFLMTFFFFTYFTGAVLNGRCSTTVYLHWKTLDFGVMLSFKMNCKLFTGGSRGLPRQFETTLVLLEVSCLYCFEISLYSHCILRGLLHLTFEDGRGDTE